MKRQVVLAFLLACMPIESLFVAKYTPAHVGLRQLLKLRGGCDPKKEKEIRDYMDKSAFNLHGEGDAEFEELVWGSCLLPFCVPASLEMESVYLAWPNHDSKVGRRIHQCILYVCRLQKEKAYTHTCMLCVCVCLKTNSEGKWYQAALVYL